MQREHWVLTECLHHARMFETLETQEKEEISPHMELTISQVKLDNKQVNKYIK